MSTVKIRTLLIFFILLAVIISAGYFVLVKNQGRDQAKNSDYTYFIEHEKKKYTALVGERVPIAFKIKNKGKAVWNSKDQNPCYLSYHLLDEQGDIIRFDNRRFPFPHKIKPTQTVEMNVTLRCPLDKGEYILEFDLLREGIAWFKEYGTKTTRIKLTVEERIWPEDKYPLSLDYGKYTKFDSNVDEINTLFKLIRLTLDQNVIDFAGKEVKVHGFSAGKEYPQIWLRDANTIIPSSQFFYDKYFIASWLEEHLTLQKENGTLEDWLDSSGASDKNTTETDQESSAVQAAYQVFKLLGPDWLEKQIKGKTVIHRLEESLTYLRRERFDVKHGLLTGAHTADWGDVDLVDPDIKAVYTDERTHWTADIYDQSMFYQACLNLAEMFQSLKLQQKEKEWRNKAEAIQKNTNRWLWQKDKGFYKIHIHLDSLRHDFDENEIFPMGGNTQAMISGLADKEKCAQIIENALERQKSFSVSTISGTLLPPYPKDFFKHPLLDDPYEYQNGAQWDWFGGRLIAAMFEQGFSKQARNKLIEIIRKNKANKGFFEWDNREGIGQGSDYYCGSAGSLGKALFEGYFGIQLARDSLLLAPKLGEDEANVHFYLPANDFFIAYDYRFSPEEKKVTLEYNSNFSVSGKVKILIPEIFNSSASEEESLEVLWDGSKIPFTLKRINQDTFITIETDFQRHTLEIRLK